MVNETSPPGATDLVAFQARAHVPSLDGVRGVAILMVLAFHVAAGWFPGAAIGVDLFFTLSGFLITGLLTRELSTTGRIDLRRFFARRAARLFPALLVLLLVLGPLAAIIEGQTSQLAVATLATALYVMDFVRSGVPVQADVPAFYAHTWSLAVEEQFYLTWPLVLVVLHRWRATLSRSIGTLVAASLLLSWLVLTKVGEGQNYFLPSGHLPALLIGALLAVRPSDKQRGPSVLRDIVAVTGLAAACIAPLSLTPGGITQTGRYLLSIIAAGALIVTAMAGRGLLSTLLRFPVLTWFGQRSYGIYLYQVPVFPITAPLFESWPEPASKLVLVAISLALAELSFRWLELPVRERVRASQSSITHRKGETAHSAANT